MIESSSNKRIINYAKLNNKKYRDQEGLFIIEGRHLVAEAIKKNIIKEIFVLDENNSYKNATVVNSAILKKLSNLKNPPKVLAIVKKEEKQEIKGNILLLDDLGDPGNLGTIIRSCVAFNYQTVILSKNSVDVYNSKVIRATEGMIFNVNIIIDDLNNALKLLKEKNYKIYATSVKNGSVPKKEKAKHALIIGSESLGIKPDLLKYCDETLYLKMNPLCESLNASVSASIIMYELNGEH